MGTLHEDQYTFMIICQLILEWEIFFFFSKFVEKYQQMHYLKLCVFSHSVLQNSHIFRLKQRSFDGLYVKVYIINIQCIFWYYLVNYL
jgi:hypothetical protein